MPQSMQSTIDMLVDAGVETLISALVLAFLIATLTAGTYFWLRRGKSDGTAILVSLIVVANLACLMTGARFIESRTHVAELRAALRQSGSLVRGQAYGHLRMSRFPDRSAHRSRRNSLPGGSAAKQLANAETVAAAPK